MRLPPREARNLAPGRPGAPPGRHQGLPARSWLIGMAKPSRKARPGIANAARGALRGAHPSPGCSTPRKRVPGLASPAGAKAPGRRSALHPSDLSERESRDGDRAPHQTPERLSMSAMMGRDDDEARVAMKHCTRGMLSFPPPKPVEDGRERPFVGEGGSRGGNPSANRVGLR